MYWFWCALGVVGGLALFAFAAALDLRSEKEKERRRKEDALRIIRGERR